MALITSSSKGVFVIAVTPFTETGALDHDSIDRMVDFYDENGADGLTILGMMGEAPKLTQAESIEVTKRTLARAGAQPVVVGVPPRPCRHWRVDQGRNGSWSSRRDGCASLLAAHRRSDRHLLSQRVETVGTDVPSCCRIFPVHGVQISTKTLGVIFEAHPSIVMLKHEDWPGLQKISDLRQAEAKAGAASQSSAAMQGFSSQKKCSVVQMAP